MKKFGHCSLLMFLCSCFQDYEFVTYNKDKTTISVSGGTLRIKPAILPDELVRNGDLDLGDKYVVS